MQSCSVCTAHAAQMMLPGEWMLCQPPAPAKGDADMMYSTVRLSSCVAFLTATCCQRHESQQTASVSSNIQTASVGYIQNAALPAGDPMYPTCREFKENALAGEPGGVFSWSCRYALSKIHAPRSSPNSTCHPSGHSDLLFVIL